MPTNREYGSGRIFRGMVPKIRHGLLWRAFVSFLLVPSLFALTLAGERRPAAGAPTSTLITPGVAIGAVRLGMPAREVTAILGAGTPGKGGQVRFPRWGITVNFADGVVSNIWKANSHFRTKFGAGVRISLHEATRLVGDENLVVTRSGGSSTVLYPFQGIGFVFSAARAVAVFVKPPLVLGHGPANVLGPSQPSSTNRQTQPTSGGTTRPAGTSSGTATPAGGGGGWKGDGNSSGGTSSKHGSNSTTSGGSTGSSGSSIGPGGSTASGGSTGSGSSSPLSVSVDGNGNLVVNGAPFLLIQGTSTDYGWWYAAGYTRAQADAKMTQMVQNGFNTNFTPWATMDNFWPGGDSTLYQDVLMWNLHGLYQHGSAALDDQTQGIPADYGILNNPDIVRVMNRFKSRPNLLLWWIDGEYNYSDKSAAKYCTGATTVQGQDPTRPWGDVAVNSMNATQWEQILGRCMPVTWVEGVIARAGHGTGEAFINLYDGLTAVNQAWNDGYRFVLGFSTTPIEELDPGAVGDTRSCTDHYNAMRIPTAAEIHRYFMYQVANNVRAFDMLWAPNQRCSALPPGDNLSPAYLATWNNTMTTISRVKSLAPVILAPGRWQPLGTTPAFTPYAPSPTNNDFKGIYAAKKTFAGKIYVIACDVDVHEDGIDQNKWTENAVSNATIELGQRITSVTRLFESTPAPAFSGGVITDSFAPMGVHVYVVTF